MQIDLVPTRDILASVAALDDAPFTVGFAAATENLRDYALAKLEKKNLDMIVANAVGHDRGFDTDENTITVFWRGGEKAFATATKPDLARALVALIAENYDSDHGRESAVAETVVPIRQ
jgi:phosphopantothenoylcysteine decarboxylase/phosphopantothenate--cysteine ligase